MAFRLKEDKDPIHRKEKNCTNHKTRRIRRVQIEIKKSKEHPVILKICSSQQQVNKLKKRINSKPFSNDGMNFKGKSSLFIFQELQTSQE